MPGLPSLVLYVVSILMPRDMVLNLLLLHKVVLPPLVVLLLLVPLGPLDLLQILQMGRRDLVPLLLVFCPCLFSFCWPGPLILSLFLLVLLLVLRSFSVLLLLTHFLVSVDLPFLHLSFFGYSYVPFAVGSLHLLLLTHIVSCPLAYLIHRFSLVHLELWRRLPRCFPMVVEDSRLVLILF